MGKMTFNLCEELHQKIRNDVAADEQLTTSAFMERIIREHYESPTRTSRLKKGPVRTMAFTVSEELFHRVKKYLAAHEQQTQRGLVVGMVEQALGLWEAGQTLVLAEMAASSEQKRTLAFEVSEDLFQRIKAYLTAHKKLTQKEFVVGLLENAISHWEAGREIDGSVVVEVVPKPTEEEKHRRSFNPLTGEFAYPPKEEIPA